MDPALAWEVRIHCSVHVISQAMYFDLCSFIYIQYVFMLCGVHLPTHRLYVICISMCLPVYLFDVIVCHMFFGSAAS